MKSGNLNFLEPSAPLHACNGTAFLLVKEDNKYSRKRNILYIQMNYISHSLIPCPEFFYEKLVNVLIVNLRFS